MNKADELYIRENQNKSAQEIAEEIDLSVELVAAALSSAVKASTKSIVKKARITANGQKAGAMLTQELAESAPIKSGPKDVPHLYKSNKKD